MDRMPYAQLFIPFTSNYMTDTPNLLKNEQLEIVRILYPWYKEEVFSRREQMMRLTAFGSAFLVLLLITL